jgi:large subunit ribosomal protein L29
MNMSEVKELSNEQLVHTELQLERDLIDARFQKELGTLENSSVFSVIRKDIARLRTEQRSREITEGLGSDSLRNKFRGSFQASEKEEEESSGTGFLKGISEK